MKLKLPRFLTGAFLITFCSLLYVYQQSEIFRLGYSGQRKVAYFQDLLDRNTILRYNIEKNASLTHIGSKVSEAKDYEMPSGYRLVKLAGPSENLKLSNGLYNKTNIFSRLFGIKRQAEAKTINPDF